MAESQTAVISEGTSERPTTASTRYVRARPVHERSTQADLLLARALERLDRAGNPTKARSARESIRALGPSVYPSVLAELEQAQPPDRLDVLIDLLLRSVTADELVDVASRTVSATLRASLATALAHAAKGSPAERVVRALLELTRDPDERVRFSAVEAIGIAELADRPVLLALNRIAEEDPSPAVRSEARSILDSGV